MKELLIVGIQGLSEQNFQEFDDLNLTINFREQGPVNHYEEKIVEYVIIATLVFPFDFVKDLFKDKAKETLKKLKDKILKNWKNLGSKKPTFIRAGQEPEHREPKLKIVFPISKEEYSTIELSNEVSEDVLKDTIDQYFEFLGAQFKHRIIENKIKPKSKIVIRTEKKNRK